MSRSRAKAQVVAPSKGKDPLVRQAVLAFLLFLLPYALTTALTFRDYACHWDSGHVIEGGQRTFDYYFRGDREGIAANSDLFKDHNFLYAAFLVLLTGGKAVPVETYHLLSMTCALVLYLGAYLLFLRETRHPFWALMGPYALFLSPTLMGHIPANLMDAPNAGWYGLCLILIHLSAGWGQGSLARVLLLSVAFGTATALRVSGLTLFPVLFLFDLLILRPRERIGWRPWLLKEAAVLGAVLLLGHWVTALLWPYLLHGYPDRLLGILAASTQLPWSGGARYFGSTISNLDLPWHYLPVWILLTTPLVLLVPALLGPRFRRTKDPWLVLCAIALAVNLAAWVVMRPVIHSGIRHFLYLLPIVSLAGARVLVDLARSLLVQPKGRGKGLVLLLLACGVLLPVVTMVRIHPYQYLYYSEWIGGPRGGFRYFEKDYWVTANKEAIEWIARATQGRSPGAKVKVKTFGSEQQSRVYMAPWMEYCDCPQGGWDFRVQSSFQGPLTDENKAQVVHRVERLGEPLAWVLAGPSAR